MTIRQLSILLVLVAALLAGALAAPARAEETPCWVRLVEDWNDGRIEGTYPVRCYREAIREMPEDLRAYSEARRDIERALLNALREGEERGDPLGEDDPVPPSNGDPGDGSSGEGEALPSGGRDDGDGPFGFLEGSNAGSLPIPLLVLAGLAGLLLSAGSASYVARRIQARRVPASALPPDGDAR